jgi:putative DNA-binding protein
VPTLLELQNALRRSVVDRDGGEAAAMLAGHVAPNRLDIYRNTFVSSLTKALRLCYPAVHRLVGDDFFEATAGAFIVEYPPCSAYLDEYGADFPEFLLRFPPAAGLPYLPEVARLEWSVSRAVHAPDLEPVDPARLAELSPEDQGRICFVPHPSVGLVCANYPIDAIWRGVLGEDDAALAAVDLDAGPVHLLVQRLASGVEVLRLDKSAWSFADELCSGRPLQAALDAAVNADASVLLAEHLAARRFIGFSLAAPSGTSPNDAPCGEVAS